MLNLGILAHVDAGKTTRTERLLFAAGVIDEVGSVDAGSTQTDSLDLERQRGITIKSAVVSFVVGDTTVNLIDTPGHPDFIAEVERVLGVLDGVVLVVSAVEGVQPQTRVLMRTLQRLRIPTLLFVNKLDRRGADGGRVLGELAERLTPAVVAMGSVTGPGTRGCRFVPYGAADAAFTARLADLLADHDEALLAAYLDDEAALPYRRLRRALRTQTGRALVPPGFFGSAITGAGVEALTAGITELLPLAKLWGLALVQIGDTVGGSPAPPAGGQFAPPTLETVVVPRRPADRGPLHAALAQLAEQDPLIDLRQEVSVSLYGEVQKEVVQATLAADYGLEVRFRESTTLCIERPAGSGAAFELIAKEPDPFLATVGLRVDPARPAAGWRSGWRSSSGRCRTRSSWPSRRPCARPWARGCTAGR
jgi:ribosomal protection tetracycline resistance protein